MTPEEIAKFNVRPSLLYRDMAWLWFTPTAPEFPRCDACGLYGGYLLGESVFCNACAPLVQARIDRLEGVKSE